MHAFELFVPIFFDSRHAFEIFSVVVSLLVSGRIFHISEHVTEAGIFYIRALREIALVRIEHIPSKLRPISIEYRAARGEYRRIVHRIVLAHRRIFGAVFGL